MITIFTWYLHGTRTNFKESEGNTTEKVFYLLVLCCMSNLKGIVGTLLYVQFKRKQRSRKAVIWTAYVWLHSEIAGSLVECYRCK